MTIREQRRQEMRAVLATHNTHLTMEEQAIERLLATRNRTARQYGYPETSCRDPRQLLEDIVIWEAERQYGWDKEEA